MSMWEQSIDKLVRIKKGQYGLKVPFTDCSDIDLKGEANWYRDFSLVLTRADDGDCCDDVCGCCNDGCCNCCDDEPKKEKGFKAVYRALNYTNEGELYFRFDDDLFNRGAGRYEGMLQRGYSNECDGEGYDGICPFVLIIDDLLCLDWKRAKSVSVNKSKFGGCEDGA